MAAHRRLGRLWEGIKDRGPVVEKDYLCCFAHSHGGTGCGSTHKPFLASRAFLSNPSSTVSPGAYFLYHQHQPSLTSE
jgi:hypothetical protein